MELKHIRVNQRIRAKEIRVIGVNGEQLGIMTPEEGLRRAEEAGLDLVEIAPSAVPSVCRIMDFSKYKYQQAKREREAKKHQRVIHIKEVRVKPHIDQHDYQVKLQAAERFLQRGDKVKLTVKFRGREMSHMETGNTLLERFKTELSSMGEVEKTPVVEGRMITMVFMPKPGTKGKPPNAET